MAARRAGSPNLNADKGHSTHSRVSTGARNSNTTKPTDLVWVVRTQETFTAVTEDGLVCVVSHTRFDHGHGNVSEGTWHAQVTNGDGVTLMQGADDDRDTAFASVGEYLAALALARERDPQAHATR